jgi:hypothetical protein
MNAGPDTQHMGSSQLILSLFILFIYLFIYPIYLFIYLFIYLLKDEHVHEVCRYGGAELHSVAAFLGGCAAHEAIKLLTGQYVPIDNIVLYNAVTSNVSTFKV